MVGLHLLELSTRPREWLATISDALIDAKTNKLNTRRETGQAIAAATARLDRVFPGTSRTE